MGVISAKISQLSLFSSVHYVVINDVYFTLCAFSLSFLIMYFTLCTFSLRVLIFHYVSFSSSAIYIIFFIMYVYITTRCALNGMAVKKNGQLALVH